jgi:hypothetical protein
MAKLGTPNSADVPAQWPRYEEATDQHLLLQQPVLASSGLAKAHCDHFATLPRQGKYPIT